MPTLRFDELPLDPRLLKAIASLKHTEPTPIQAQAIGPAIEGRDVLGCAQTGTGKTGAFALPTLHRLCQGRARSSAPRALVLAPTRELAVQIAEAFNGYARFVPQLRIGLLIGGVSMGPQSGMLRRGVDVIVATPGRLKDHMDRGGVRLGDVEVAIFDEADRMLDMGFIRDVRAIMRHVPQDRQTLLFSATLPRSIMSLADELLHDAVRVEVQSQASTPKSVVQSLFRLHSADKRAALLQLLGGAEMTQTIVFARTKHGADKLAYFLAQNGQKTEVLHGNKSQSQRQHALARFKRGEAPVLVATDIAARGIDVQGVSHVVNFDLPQSPEDYVHRIGRTGRAQATGAAISLVSPEEASMMRSIERLTGVRVTVQELDGFASANDQGAPPPRRRRPRRRFAA